MDIEKRLPEPGWLVLARQSRGLTQKELADLLSVNQGWLSRVESGLRGVSDDKLLQIANVLNYPPEFLSQDDPIYLRGLSSVFHRKRQGLPDRILDKAYAQLSITSTALERLLPSVEIIGAEIKPIDLSEFNGTIEDVARAVRDQLGLPRGPVQNITKTLENVRAIVIPFDFGTRRIDAISFWPLRSLPLFFVNLSSPGDRLRFTLCHELGHIVMHQNDIREDMESEANRFAAEFLMPSRQIEPYLHDLTLSKLAALKVQWKVSMGALIKRASNLNTITEGQAKYLWVQMGRNGYKQREPEEIDVPVEIPHLYREIIDTCQNELQYSIPELCKLLRLSEEDVRRIFIEPPQYELAKSLIEEAEQILKSNDLEQGG